MNTKRLVTTRLSALFLALLILVMSFAGCSKSVNIDSDGAADIKNYPVTVNEVTISSKPTKGVVIGASLADVVLAIGYETSLCAVTEDCTQEDYETLAKIKADDADAIIELGADVVIAESFTDEMSGKLSEAGITMVEIKPARTREDFERLYTQVGSIFGGAKDGYNSALTCAENIFTSLDDLSRIIPDRNNTVVTGCYLYDIESSAVTGEQLASVIMEYAGVTNVFKGSSGGTYEYDNLRMTNPDYIFCPVGMKSTIEKNEDFAALRALKNKHVFEIDSSMVNMQGRTVILFATEVASNAFPELAQESSQAPTTPEVMNKNKDEKKEESKTEEPKEVEDGDEIITDEEPDAESSSDEETEEVVLKKGDQNDDVFDMQYRLDELGYLTEEYDGYFGEITETALKKFQKKNGLEETGIADANTLEVLMSSKAKKK